MKNNFIYRRTDEVEKLSKHLEDTDKQLVSYMAQIKAMVEEKEQRQKELEELRLLRRTSSTWWILWKKE